MTSIALALYDLFKDVDRRLSAILVILVSISSAIAVASGIFLSRFFPRFLGAWLIAGGVAWVAISFVNIVLPDYSKLAFNAAQPFTLAEVAAMIWLIKGPSVGSSVASYAAVP